MFIDYNIFLTLQYGGFRMKILKQIKGEDNSTKYLFLLDDGNSIETLYMHDKEQKLTYHSTVCVSSQVGCNIGCRFCATGEQGFIRNLQESEILQQIDICNEYCKDTGISPIDAVVFAGMGEPLLNYKNITAAIREIQYRYNIHNFELATAGIVPRVYDLIKDFSDTEISIRLNLSLHGSCDSQRRRLIPLTSKYGVKEILAAAIDYAKAFNNKARIRYMLIKGLNDTDEDVSRLIALLEGKPLKLIISQYNENNIEGLYPSEPLDILSFYNKINKRIDCEIFYNFGSSIQGGCGQLRRAEIAV
jgi:23S rRNA (adenine2503-C2)-methyltransferase